MNSVLSFVLLSAFFVSSPGTSVVTLKDPVPCGDWIPYKDEKCLKIVTKAGHQTQEDAKIMCESYSDELNGESYPRLVTVKTKEEQEFLENFIFVENNIKDAFWLGLKEVGDSGEFVWNDGYKPVYTNWANQNMSDGQHHCVQMESGAGVISVGLWGKVHCDKSIAVVCERTQTLTLQGLHSMFVNYKVETSKELENAKKGLADANKEIADANKEIAELKDNPVPVGFIYVQLANQQPPTTLWPQTKWTDVTSTYEGLFFRAAGESAAAFGEIQEESTSRLEQVEYAAAPNGQLACVVGANSLPADGTWTPFIWSGRDSGGYTMCLRFRLLANETRPRNQAVQIWQRNA